MIDLIEHRLREVKEGVIVKYQVSGKTYRVYIAYDYDTSSEYLMYHEVVGQVDSFPGVLSSPTKLFKDDLIDAALAARYYRT